MSDDTSRQRRLLALEAAERCCEHDADIHYPDSESELCGECCVEKALYPRWRHKWGQVSNPPLKNAPELAGNTLATVGRAG